MPSCTLNGVDSYYNGIAFVPENPDYLVCTSRKRNSVELWHIDSEISKGHMISSFSLPSIKSPHGVVITPDAKEVYVATQTIISVEPDSYEEVRSAAENYGFEQIKEEELQEPPDSPEYIFSGVIHKLKLDLDLKSIVYEDYRYIGTYPTALALKGMGEDLSLLVTDLGDENKNGSGITEYDLNILFTSTPGKAIIRSFPVGETFRGYPISVAYLQSEKKIVVADYGIEKDMKNMKETMMKKHIQEQELAAEQELTAEQAGGVSGGAELQ